VRFISVTMQLLVITENNLLSITMVHELVLCNKSGNVQVMCVCVFVLSYLSRTDHVFLYIYEAQSTLFIKETVCDGLFVRVIRERCR
jgi:hypothetical protein